MGGRHGKHTITAVSRCKTETKGRRDIRTTTGKETDAPNEQDYVEGVVCHKNDVGENQMSLFPLGSAGGKVLVIKQKGELYALGPKCTHLGAFLNNGALGEGRVRCPWHGACFNIKTGDIEDYPGLDSLPCHKITINENDQVVVKAKRTELESNKRMKSMCPLDKKNSKTVVIVGGGPAGATCAESLRQENFTGRIVMVCKEGVLPYDRTKVSKQMDMDIKRHLLRPSVFYDDNNIEVKLEAEATSLDTNSKILTLITKETIAYDKLFICTGSKPFMPNIPGIDSVSNVFGVRDYTDAVSIRSELSKDKHVVILGSSFIGLEAATYCVDKSASVTIIGRDNLPLRNVFGTDIGRKVKEEFEAKGVRFMMNTSIVKFEPKEGEEKTGGSDKKKGLVKKPSIGSVKLSDDSTISADLVIVGIGATYNTDWMKGSGVEIRENGSISTDKYLQTNIEDVYVGGDIAYAPILGSEEIKAAIGHYSLAHYHGKIAALNICGKETPLRSVPFFWTTLFGKSYRYSGYGPHDKIKLYGDVNKLEFYALYLKDGNVIAASSVGADPIVADFANMLYEEQKLTEAEIDSHPNAWIKNKPKDMEERFKLVIQP